MDIKKLLMENGITPKKELDQFFLTDERIIDREIELADLNKNDVVLEIGPGPGNLTRKITEKCKVIAIEKDTDFRALVKGITNTNVVFGDAVEVLESLRLRKQEDKKKGKTPAVTFNKIVSNIPYSRSQDILVELLQHEWKTAVLVVQKEFADKLKSKEKVALAVEDTCNLQIADYVPADAFYPTAVPSSIIVLKQKKTLSAGFWDFLLLTYRDRNRDAGNIIQNAPSRLAKKKIHQLDIEELKFLFEYQKGIKEGNP